MTFTIINCMIHLQNFKSGDLPFLNYELDEIQAGFTSSADSALQKIKERNDKGDFEAFPVTIFMKEIPVGFFVLDFGNDRLGLTENPKSVLLRSLSINPKFQGKGIGTISMKNIPEFIENYFPEKAIEEIVLAVNNKNTGAYKTYLKAGYKDFGKTRPWKNGFQHFLSLKI